MHRSNARYVRYGSSEHKRRKTIGVELDIASGAPNGEVMRRWEISYAGLVRIKQRMLNDADHTAESRME